MKKKVKTILYLISIIILIIIYFTIKSEKFEFQDNLIFFKIFNQSNKVKQKEESKKTSQYNIQVSKNEKVYQDINLMQTIDTQNLINEKIAPGVNGKFEIILNSDCNLKYQIGFISKNAKPKNLKFYLKENGEKYNTLEELQKELHGKIDKNQTIRIWIYWQWEYEINQEENKQDTEDGRNIEKYNFEIYTIGK